MKRLFLYMMAGIMAVPVMWSCDDAESPALPNSIYFIEATSRDEYDCLIKPMREATYNVTVKMTHKVDHDVTLNILVDKELLVKHYEEFGEEIDILPTDNWILYDTEGVPHAGDNLEVTFPANQTVAVLPIKILPVENAEVSQFALPLTIQAVSEDIHVLEKLRSQLFVFQAPFETTGVAFGVQKMKLESNLTLPPLRTWTLEFHFHIRRGYSQPLYGCPLTNLGPSEIYVRQYHNGGGMDIHILGTFGPGSYNVSKRGYPSDYYYNTAYEGKWSHFALVCQNGTITSYLDGEEMTVTSSPQFDTDFNETHVQLGDQNQESFLCYTEYRFWSIARTPQQISRFKYTVNPNEKGLEMYYPLHEDTAVDDKMKDVSHNGFDLDLTDKSINWVRIKTNDDFTSFETVK